MLLDSVSIFIFTIVDVRDHAVPRDAIQQVLPGLQVIAVRFRAEAFADACAVNPTESPIFLEALAILPAGLFSALVLACGARMRFEEIEKFLDWPARSAKLALHMALAEIQRRGVI